MLKRILMLTVVLLLMAPLVWSQTTLPATYTWTVPTTGTPVVAYNVYLSTDGGEWIHVATTTTNSITLTLPVMDSHRVRVSAEDAADREGPVSVASDPYVPDPGPPSGCGKPERQ
jgi:hypothetical protein